MNQYDNQKRIDELDEASDARRYEYDLRVARRKKLDKRFEALEDRTSFLENHNKVLENRIEALEKFANLIVKTASQYLLQEDELEKHEQPAICMDNKTRGECECQECNTLN